MRSDQCWVVCLKYKRCCAMVGYASYQAERCLQGRALADQHPLDGAAVCRALREAARLGATCAVSGDGADELFGEYDIMRVLDVP